MRGICLRRGAKRNRLTDVTGIEPRESGVPETGVRHGSRKIDLSPDNLQRAANEILVSVRRRGETASGKRRRGARLASQAGLAPRRRDAEVVKSQPVARLGTVRG